MKPYAIHTYMLIRLYLKLSVFHALRRKLRRLFVFILWRRRIAFHRLWKYLLTLFAYAVRLLSCINNFFSYSSRCDECLRTRCGALLLSLWYTEIGLADIHLTLCFLVEFALRVVIHESLVLRH